MDVCFVNNRRYKNLRSCLVFYRHENILVCELICMITGVLFIRASNCTDYFLYHITLHVRSIEMYLGFVLCSLHSSVLCGLWLDMCDIWSVVYARRTYCISFPMPLFAQSSFYHVEMHEEQADFTTVTFMVLVYELMCLMSGLYFMPARDYTCCFLYVLLHLTTSLLTCWYTSECDRSMCYLVRWLLGL